MPITDPEERKKLISIAENMPKSEVEVLAGIVNMDTKVDPENPLDNLMPWLAEVISRFMTIRNSTKTAYSGEVSDDIAKALYHLLEKDSRKEFPEHLNEVYEVYNTTLDLLKAHFEETFVGKKKYVPLEEIPIIDWSWSTGSLLSRLSTFTSLFYITQHIKETQQS